MVKHPSSFKNRLFASLFSRFTAAFYLPYFVSQTVEETNLINQNSVSDGVELNLTSSNPLQELNHNDGLGVPKSNYVGGQAVIEGVMMRSRNNVATAVRTPDGRIVCKLQKLSDLSNGFFKKPIARGAGMLFETLKLGINTLDWSAKIAAMYENQSPIKWWEKILQTLSLPLGLLLALSLFLWLPYSVAKWTVGAEGNQFLYHLVSNAIQMTILIIYIWLISLSKEVRRIFEYHGAEHKAIMCYEAGDRVVPERMQHHTRFHPRCGTSFLLVLGLVTMLFFSILDATLLMLGWVYPNAIVRVLFHLPFVPIVGGIGYEILKLSDRKKKNRIVAALIQPGLWLQRITTREPNLQQLEVSAVSLRAAILGYVEENEQVISEAAFNRAA